MRQKVLMTGASGLIGSHLCKALAPQCDLHLIVRRKDSGLAQYGTEILVDLSSPFAPASLPPQADVVIHLAQSLQFRQYPERAQDIFAVNVASTARLLDWAYHVKVKAFICASSGGVYGYGDRGFTEQAPLHTLTPLGFYLASRQCAELLVENYSDQFTTVILRFFFVYGNGQNPTMLIPRLVRSIMERHPIILQGQEGFRLNPVHVSDAVRAILACLKLKESHKINVAGPEILTLREVGEIIGQHLQEQPQFEVLQDQRPHHLIGDIAKMNRLLGVPQVRFEEGVKSLCKQVLSQ